MGVLQQKYHSGSCGAVSSLKSTTYNKSGSPLFLKMDEAGKVAADRGDLESRSEFRSLAAL
jgi:hypothetical protein